MVPDDVTVITLVSLDDDIIATAPEISKAVIVKEFRNGQENDEEEESDDDASIKKIFVPVVEKPSRSEIESA